MPKERITAVRLKETTKEKLDNIMKLKASESIKEDPKRFIEALVKNKGKIVPYNNAVNYILDFYLESIKVYERLSLAEKKKSEIGKLLKKVGRMNSVY